MAPESQRAVKDNTRQKYVWGKIKIAQRTLGLCCFTCILRARLPSPAGSTGQAGPEELQKKAVENAYRLEVAKGRRGSSDIAEGWKEYRSRWLK